MSTPRIVKAEMVKAADVAFTSNPVKNMHYEDCIIQGPAVLIFLGNTSLDGCSFEGPPETITWEISPERQTVLGAVGFEDCVFLRCQFRGVGIAGNREFIDNFMNNVAPEGRI